jgi:phage terminase large subunit GpA-like protein
MSTSTPCPHLLPVLGQAYQPPPSEPIWEWAEKTLRFTAAQSREFAGRHWALKNAPHTRLVFDFFADPTARELHIEKSSAAAFSTAILVGICWHVRYRPCRVLYCLNNEPEMRKVSKALLQPFLRQVFGEAVIDDKDQSTLFIELPNGSIVEMGSPTEGFFANKQASIIVLDEYDLYPDQLEGGVTDPLSAARGRFKGSQSFAKLFTLTAPQKAFDPTRREHYQPGTKQNRAYLSGDQREFRIACPECSADFAPSRRTLQFEHLRIEAAEVESSDSDTPQEERPFDMDRVRKESALRCPSCSHRIVEGLGANDKAALVRRGKWVSTWFENPPSRWSARYNDTCALIGDSALGTLAAELIDARARSRHELVQVCRARFAEPESDEDIVDLSLEHVRRHCGTYKRGTCPITPWFIALVIDCQKNKGENRAQQPILFKWIKIAFKENGEAYVIDYGQTVSPNDLWVIYGDPMAYAGPPLPEPPPPKPPPFGKAAPPAPPPHNPYPSVYCARAVIDSGYRAGADLAGEESMDVHVYPLCVSWGYRADGRWAQTSRGWVYTGSWHMIPFKGRSREQMQGEALNTTSATVAHPQHGQVEIPLHLINDHWWKTVLIHGILPADPSNPADPRLTRYPRMFFPRAEDMTDDFFEEITAERLIVMPKKVRGRIFMERVWAVQSKGKNDYSDCLKMSLAMFALINRAAVLPAAQPPVAA